MRWIYISPHLDDAVLSCGGLIWEQCRAGTPVEIWTVLAGIPGLDELSDFAKVLHFVSGTGTAAETVTLRRAEDQAAAGIVGAKAVHFDFQDCIYRRSPEGEWLYDGIFVPLHPADADLPGEVARALAARLEPDDEVICPLTIGGHVDHVMTRMAVERLGRPLRYYADIPYLQKNWLSLLTFTGGLCSEVHPVSEEGLRAWQEGVEAYASQLGSLFDPPESLRSTLQKYWECVFGVTLWESLPAGYG
ncbi:MAG: PIG-L family deacetylase [Chloroflexota bacterium]